MGTVDAMVEIQARALTLDKDFERLREDVRRAREDLQHAEDQLRYNRALAQSYRGVLHVSR